MSDSLTPDEFAELDSLFQQAVGLAKSEQSVLIDEVETRSPEMARSLVVLLEEDSRGDGTLHETIAEATRLVESDDPLLGERFGPYLLEKVIGRGGMGSVYLGRRVDDEFHQQVAIKTIRFGLESPQLLERFRDEREILARLDHPGIARLLDGGTGPRGVPYVAMEYVSGVPLTDYVSEQHCSLRRRLELFVELCDAIAFVHRNLVVHRDIKPGNVMVTDEGSVKLLDFGIAKLMDEFERGAAATETQHRAMTPEYASPEQILGQPVTTTADIYALGVLLYEILTGKRPIKFETRTPYAMAQAIIDSVPTVPSENVSRSPARLRRQLRGDLDHIVMMAMRKEPKRRYASVADLANDVRHYLAGRPVSAQVDRWHYRARKFVTRNPVATTVAVGSIAVVLGFTFLTLKQSQIIAGERDRALQAESRAESEAGVARKTSDFLTRLFNTADPRESGSREVTAHDLLLAGVRELGDENIELDPAVRASLHLDLGLALVNLEHFDDGIPSMRMSVTLNEKIYGADSLKAAEAKHRLGDVLRRVNRLDEAFELLTEALETRRRHIQEDSYEIADSYNNLAILAIEQGRYRESEDLQQASIEMHGRLTGPGSPEYGVPLCNMAVLKLRQGRLSEAGEMLQDAESALRKGSDTGSVYWVRWNLARTLQAKGQLDLTRELLEATREEYLPLVGPAHSRILSMTRDIASTWRMLGEYEKAGRTLDDLEPRLREIFGEESVQWVHFLVERGRLDRATGDPDSAVTRIRKAIDIHAQLRGSRHYRTVRFQQWLAEAEIDLGRMASAEEGLRRALSILPDPNDYVTIERAAILTRLGRVLRSQGRLDEAADTLAEARRIVDEVADSACIETGELLFEEALAEIAAGNAATARHRFEAAAAALEGRLPRSHPTMILLRQYLN